MKGIICKDLYLSWKFYKPYFFIAVFFAVLSLWTDNNVFMLSYPMMLIGMIPMGLQNMDETYKWDVYCGAMPVTKKQMVTEKYLMGILFMAPVTVVMLLAKALGMVMAGDFQWAVLRMLLLIAWMLGFLIGALSLPLIFRFGSEKGRIVQLGIIGAACGVSAILGLQSGGKVPAFAGSGAVMAVLVGIPVVLYGLSWRLSVRFYEKREIC